MRRADSPRLVAYAGLAAVGLVAGLAAGRVELVALAAPFALAAALGASLTREPRIAGRLTLDRERALEGENVKATLQLKGTEGAARIDVLLPLPDELTVKSSGKSGGNPVAIPPDKDRLELTLGCARWGAFRVGPALVRAHDALGFHTWEADVGVVQPLRVYPSVETMRALLEPLETQAYVGNQVARTRGDGIEFADIREWTPGDRLRRVNWRASARRGDLWVNEQHPERNTDIVLFLDTFTDVSLGHRGTLDLTVRAAASLAHRYLQRKDRVGVISFGGFLSWLLPTSGTRQLYRIVDSLLQMGIVLSFAAKNIDILPPRTLPPRALVLALTPLLDSRSTAALVALRARGFDLVVVEISPLPFVEPKRDELADLSYRLWSLSRDAQRAQYERAGIPIVPWTDGEALDAVLEEVRAYRRHARPARA
jgi:uncharacterized protein (DUF58 family)